MSWGMKKDLGAYLKPLFAAINKTLTAASTGDATEVDGAWIDRKGYDSLDVLIPFTAALGAGETLTFAAQFRESDSPNGSTPSDFGAAVAAAVAATGDSGGSTETGVHQIGIDLTKAKRYVQVQITPNLSAGGADTAEWAALYALLNGVDAPANPSRVTAAVAAPIR